MLYCSGAGEISALNTANVSECIKGDNRYEENQDFGNQRFKGVHEEGRLRRVPDLLPVCMQDLLYSRKPDL